MWVQGPLQWNNVKLFPRRARLRSNDVIIIVVVTATSDWTNPVVRYLQAEGDWNKRCVGDGTGSADFKPYQVKIMDSKAIISIRVNNRLKNLK